MSTIEIVDQREQCKRCYAHNPLGFTVPDDVWESVTRETGYERKVLCIRCFDELATQRAIDWSTDTHIEFWPVSGASVGVTARPVREFVLPLPVSSLAPPVTMTGPFPVTAEEWDYLMLLLDTMRPALAARVEP